MKPSRSAQPNQRIWPSKRRTRTIADRAADALARWRDALAAFASPPGVITTDDAVTYRPLSRITLAKALAPEGPGQLEFVVTFPANTPPTRAAMRIRATRDRRFADLEPEDPPFRHLTAAAIETVRPGDRVVILGAGTGALTAALAEHVGPSGAVTAFETDAQSVAFARARYPAPNAAHERLGRSTVTAEPAGAAESIVVTPLVPPQSPTDLWHRITSPGRLVLAGPHAALAEPLRTHHGATVRSASIPPESRESPVVIAEKRPDRVASTR